MAPDGGTFDPKVLEEITREIKTFGDNQKQLKESLMTDLASVRSVAEAAKGAIGPEVKSQIDALTASVTEKQAAFEKKLTGSLDELSAKLNRKGMGPGGDDKNEEAFKTAARLFHRANMGAKGVAMPADGFKDEDIDFEGIRAWDRKFGTYLRATDDRVIEAKTLSVGSNPDGGQWVAPTVSARIIQQIYESSPLRELATIETITGPELDIFYDLDEADAGWVGETGARTSNNDTPQVGQGRIPVHEMYASPKATQKLLEDAGIDIEMWLANKVATKMGRVEATAFISGNGVAKPRGILSYSSGTTLPGTIQQIASGHATQVTSDGLINTMIGLKEAYAGNAQWLMRRATIGSVMLLKDGDGQYIWRAGLEAGKPSILLGYPVRQAADMPAVAAGALSIAFGDFRQAYTIVDRLGITTLRDPYTAKPFVVFYSRKRVGGAVVNFEALKLMVIGA